MLFSPHHVLQGTPGTYLPPQSHAVYIPEVVKTTGGSISLGLPRQQDPAKPGERERFKSINKQSSSAEWNSILPSACFGRVMLSLDDENLPQSVKCVLWTPVCVCICLVSYIKQEECSPRGQSAQAEGLLSRAQYDGVVRGELIKIYNNITKNKSQW